MKKIITIGILLILTIVISINIIVILQTKKQILTIEKLTPDKYDCILVLGAGIRNNKPSPMLEDRLTTSIELYNQKYASKILVSGDHTKKDYDEVNVMKNYILMQNIPSEDIFMDHAGISTYDSIYRAKNIFKANKILIVTQEYHLHRAIYIANQLEVEAYGVIADKNTYIGQSKRNIREFIARIKDFIKCIIKPQSKYLGEVFPINGNGDKTNDK